MKQELEQKLKDQKQVFNDKTVTERNIFTLHKERTAGQKVEIFSASLLRQRKVRTFARWRVFSCRSAKQLRKRNYRQAMLFKTMSKLKRKTLDLLKVFSFVQLSIEKVLIFLI